MKESGITHWASPNEGATNESGFTALPGGGRFGDGAFDYVGIYGNWWSSSEDSTVFAWRRGLGYDGAGVYRNNGYEKNGFSVRCVKGEGSTTTTTPSIITNATTFVNDTTATLNGNVTDDGGAPVTDRGFYYSTSQNPQSTGTQISEGSGIGVYSSYPPNNLTPGTTYYLVAYATNSIGTAYGDELSFTTTSTDVSTITDYDGNVYQTVQIGDQIWMQENLKVTHFSDGTAIPLVEKISEWDAIGADNQAYCWYDNNQSTGNVYGALYTRAAAVNGIVGSYLTPSGVQGVCPSGWHLPSDEEWKQLELFVGMNQSMADASGWRGTIEGGKLKESGTALWLSPNTSATNESGFSALPGGYRGYNVSFSYAGHYGHWWTASEHSSTTAWFRGLASNSGSVYRFNSGKWTGLSVLCVKDSP